MTSTSFKARLKRPNRLFLNTLKIRFRVRSAAAALNRLLDLERSEAVPQIQFVICGGCQGKVPTVSTNRYVVCPKCQDVFTADNQVALVPAGEKEMTTLEEKILLAHDRIAYVSMPKQTTSGKWRNEQYFVCMQCAQRASRAEKIKHLDTCMAGYLLAQDQQFK